MPLTRLQQVLVMEEAQEATPQTLAALAVAANASILVSDPKVKYDTPRYQRNVRRDSLTPLQGLSGIRTGTLSFQCELTASGTAATLPIPLQFDRLLRACGMRLGQCARLTVGTITGAEVIRHGTIITGGTSSATAMVVGDFHEGMTTMFVTRSDGLGTGTFTAGETISASGGISATASAVQASGGAGYWPWSHPITRLVFDATGTIEAIAAGDTLESDSGAFFQAFAAATVAATQSVYVKRLTGHNVGGDTITNVRTGNASGDLNASLAVAESQIHIPTLTMAVALDGVIKMITCARGTVSLQVNIGEPGILTFEFRGLIGEVADRGNVTGVSFPQRVPPVLLGAVVGVGNYADTLLAEEVQPCITAFSVNMQNTLGYRRCASATTGVLEAIITGRTPQATMDPDLMVEEFFPWTDQQLENRLNRLRVNVGSTAPDRFLLQVPAASIREEDTGDRDGEATRQLSFDLTSGSSSVGAGDNEFVLIWHAQ